MIPNFYFWEQYIIRFKFHQTDNYHILSFLGRARMRSDISHMSYRTYIDIFNVTMSDPWSDHIILTCETKPIVDKNIIRVTDTLDYHLWISGNL